ncbi:hypothetical protein F4212_11315, partial [Candidatus Poribacteria bacterium]|nr:hypothetical protein [Candidatus Poribacteria bacterium]
LCINWINRNKSLIQSIEDTPAEEIENSSYAHYELEKRKMETDMCNSTIVKKLLAKLPESERTVMTLYHLGEMNALEISKFLGVSLNTIKSRLRRARNRLEGNEEILITEKLRSVQLATDLTENIMRRIVDIKPSPPVAKPILPWTAFGTAAVLVLLMLGTMPQYIAHFQQPYDFEAFSEPTIEIVESPINIDIVSIPTEHHKNGRGVIDSSRDGASTTVSDDDLVTNTQENGLNSSAVQWTQTNGPQAPVSFNLFATSKNNIHAVSRTGIYRLAKDRTTWMNISTNVPINTHRSPITEHRGIIYSVNTNDIFASTDNGQTWRRFCSRPKGNAIGLIIRVNTQEKLIMYLALKDEGVFRSADAGRKWFPLNNGLTGQRVTAVALVGNSVFIGTNRGLYRLNSGVWNRLQVDPLKTVHSIAVFENNLYVVTGPDFLSPDFFESNTPDKMSRKIYHSGNSGVTWREITPKDNSFIKRPSFIGPTKISVVDKTLLVLGIPAFRSMDSGQTWIKLGFDINLLPSKYTSVIAVNENTFYNVGQSGILRTIDSGDSWHSFMNGMSKTKVRDLVAFNNILYVYTGTGFFKSVDDGSSWEEVHIDYGEYTPKLTNNDNQPVNYFPDSKLVIANNELYGIVPRGKELHIFRLRLDDHVFSIVHKISTPKLGAKGDNAKGTNILDIGDVYLESGGFAVSGKTFYIEYMRRLLKWTIGNTEMIDTGLTDADKYIDGGLDKGFKLAASAEVVYAGKRDGSLFQSIDGGNSWRDVTSIIPSSFSHIKDITFVGSTVYVATDIGVLSSLNGDHWRMLTDNTRTPIIIDKFALDGTNFYGAGDMGIYRLNLRSRWEQISANIPDKVISLSVSCGMLYIGTEKRGIFHTTLADNSEEVRTARIQTIK